MSAEMRAEMRRPQVDHNGWDHEFDQQTKRFAGCFMFIMALAWLFGFALAGFLAWLLFRIVMHYT